MLVGELKKALQEIPDELEVVADVFERDMLKLSEEFRIRVEDTATEETKNIKPMLYPEFSGQQVLCLKFLKN